MHISTGSRKLLAWLLSLAVLLGAFGGTAVFVSAAAAVANTFDGDAARAYYTQSSNAVQSANNKGQYANLVTGAGVDGTAAIRLTYNKAEGGNDTSWPAAFSLADTAQTTYRSYKPQNGTTFKLTLWYKVENLPSAANLTLTTDVSVSLMAHNGGIYSSTRRVIRPLTATTVAGEWQQATFLFTGKGQNLYIGLDMVDDRYRVGASVLIDNVTVEEATGTASNQTKDTTKIVDFDGAANGTYYAAGGNATRNANGRPMYVSRVDGVGRGSTAAMRLTYTGNEGGTDTQWAAAFSLADTAQATYNTYKPTNGQNYELSFWYKVESLPSSATITLTTNPSRGYNLATDPVYGYNVTRQPMVSLAATATAGEWQKATYVFTAKGQNVYLSVDMVNDANRAGTSVLIDDVVLQTTGKTVSARYVNDFEGTKAAAYYGQASNAVKNTSDKGQYANHVTSGVGQDSASAMRLTYVNNQQGTDTVYPATFSIADVTKDPYSTFKISAGKTYRLTLSYKVETLVSDANLVLINNPTRGYNLSLGDQAGIFGFSNVKQPIAALTAETPVGTWQTATMRFSTNGQGMYIALDMLNDSNRNGTAVLVDNVILQEVTETVAIRFNSNGGTAVADIEGEPGVDRVVLPPAPTRQEYDFKGWYTDEALTKAYTPTTFPETEMTLYAKWEKAVLKQTYESFDVMNHPEKGSGIHGNGSGREVSDDVNYTPGGSKAIKLKLNQTLPDNVARTVINMTGADYVVKRGQGYKITFMAYSSEDLDFEYVIGSVGNPTYIGEYRRNVEESGRTALQAGQWQPITVTVDTVMGAPKCQNPDKGRIPTNTYLTIGGFFDGASPSNVKYVYIDDVIIEDYEPTVNRDYGVQDYEDYEAKTYGSDEEPGVHGNGSGRTVVDAEGPSSDGYNDFEGTKAADYYGGGSNATKGPGNGQWAKLVSGKGIGGSTAMELSFAANAQSPYYPAAFSLAKTGSGNYITMKPTINRDIKVVVNYKVENLPVGARLVVVQPQNNSYDLSHANNLLQTDTPHLLATLDAATNGWQTASVTLHSSQQGVYICLVSDDPAQQKDTRVLVDNVSLIEVTGISNNHTVGGRRAVELRMDQSGVSNYAQTVVNMNGVDLQWDIGQSYLVSFWAMSPVKVDFNWRVATAGGDRVNLGQYHNVEAAGEQLLEAGEWTKITAKVNSVQGPPEGNNTYVTIGGAYAGAGNHEGGTTNYYVYLDDVQVVAVRQDIPTLRFHTGVNGLTVADRHAFAGEPMGALPSLSREGYFLDGWYSQDGAVEYGGGYVTPNEEFIDLYAVWTAHPTTAYGITTGFEEGEYDQGVTPYFNDGSRENQGKNNMTATATWQPNSPFMAHTGDGSMMLCNNPYVTEKSVNYQAAALVNPDGTRFAVLKGQKYKLTYSYIGDVVGSAHSYVTAVVSADAATAGVGAGDQVLTKNVIHGIGNEWYTATEYFTAEATGFVYMTLAARESTSLSSSLGHVAYVDDVTVEALDDSYVELTFMRDKSDCIGKRIGKAGTTIDFPSQPTLAGAVFDGWHEDADATVPYDAITYPTTDMTLYAGFVAADYSAGSSDLSDPLTLSFEETDLLRNFLWSPNRMEWSEGSMKLVIDDASVARTGKNSLHFNKVDFHYTDRYVMLYDPDSTHNVLYLEPNTNYKVEYWYMATDDFAAIDFSLCLGNPANANPAAAAANSVKVDTYSLALDQIKVGQWVRVEHVFTTGDEPTAVSLRTRQAAFDAYVDDITVTKLIPVTVKLDTTGGEPMEDLQGLISCLLEEPIDPYRYGYIFDGWYRDKALTKPFDFATDVVMGDMTLYAKWKLYVPEEEEQPEVTPTPIPDDDGQEDVTPAPLPPTPEQEPLDTGASPDVLDAIPPVQEQTPTDTPAPDGTDGSLSVMLILIIVGAMLLIAGAAIAVVLFKKKKDPADDEKGGAAQ